MGDKVVLKFDPNKIDNSINQLQALQNRALASTNMKITMPNSKGDSKDALMEANDAMVNLLTSVATMIGKTIDDLNYVKTGMQEEDDLLAKKNSEAILKDR